MSLQTIIVQSKINGKIAIFATTLFRKAKLYSETQTSMIPKRMDLSYSKISKAPITKKTERESLESLRSPPAHEAEGLEGFLTLYNREFKISQRGRGRERLETIHFNYIV